VIVRPAHFILLSFLLVLGLFVTLWGRSVLRYVEAGILLVDIVADREERHEVQRQHIDYRHKGRNRKADLYRAPGEIKAGLILLPGVAELGGDDPRLIRFASSLSRAGFAVLVPELPGLRRLRVSSSDTEEVADAFAWLSAQPDLVPSGRMGLAAFSYASGPAILAALHERIREQVGFVFVVGGYYDLLRVVTFLTTGYFTYQGRQYYLPPDNYGKWAFVVGNIDRLENREDQRLLRLMARRLRRNPDAATQDIVSKLSAGGRALLSFISNRDPARVADLLSDLPHDIREELSALNLAGQDLSKLRAPLILVHGYEDPMIPFPESIALAQAASGNRNRLYLVHGLMHVDIVPGLADRWRLLQALHDLLAARDGVLPN
jgi:acetyl esterase/lipase